MSETIDTAAFADERFMDRALRVASRLPQRTWPNPPVGAVVVRNGAIVAEGAHLGPGRVHAERAALERAGEAARGATLYVTLEPCNHSGRTPPCAEHVAASGVRRVVVGVADPNPHVAGGGLAVLRDAGIDVVLGVRGPACLDLIWPFCATAAFRRPYVELKLAVGMDGRFSTAVPAGEARPRYLTGAAARDDVHRRRRWMDLVLVGAGTVRADRPRLDARRVMDDAPLPATDPAAGYVDTHLALATGPARDSGFVFYGAGACAAAGAPPSGFTAVPCPLRHERVEPDGLLDAAAEHGLLAIMLEGGPRLAASFLAADRVDTWVQYVAPVVTGGGAGWPDRIAAAAGSWHLRSVVRLGSDVRLIWDRRDFAARLTALTTQRARDLKITGVAPPPPAAAAEGV